MTLTTEISFWPRENDAGGYKCALIRNQLFEWKVSEVRFEEIHGLSRVVRLVPDKIITTLDIAKEDLPEHDGSFLLNLLIDLCKHYEQVTSKHDQNELLDRLERIVIRDDYLILSGSLPASEPTLTLRIGEGEIRKGQGYTISDVVVGIIDRLEFLRSCITDRRYDEYEVASLRFLSFVDEVREFCIIYLDVVHPTLIRSRRALYEESTAFAVLEKAKTTLLTHAGRLLRQVERDWFPDQA